jgi:hypothetical protein
MAFEAIQRKLVSPYGKFYRSGTRMAEKEQRHVQLSKRGIPTLRRPTGIGSTLLLPLL